MPPAGSKPTILASERSQTHSLDRAATGIANTPAADTKAKLIAFCVPFNGAVKCYDYRASNVEERDVIMDYCSNGTDRQRWAGHEAHMRERKSVYMVQVGKLRKIDHLEDPV
jgi:prephenate dehydrogenase